MRDRAGRTVFFRRLRRRPAQVRALTRGWRREPSALSTIAALGLRPQAAVLVVEIGEASRPTTLAEWGAALEREAVTLTWVGNEGDPSMRVMSRPAPPTAPRDADALRAMLIELALDGPQGVRGDLSEDAAYALELAQELPPETGDPRFLPISAPISTEQAVCWWREVELDELVTNVRGDGGEWIDRATKSARLGFVVHLGGRELRDALELLVDRPMALALHAEPREDAVSAWHVFGGIERETGALTVILVHRVWT